MTARPVHDAISFRHSGWAVRRDRVLSALILTAQSESRIKRFDNCGGSTWVFRSLLNPDRYKLVGGYCRDRFCTPCAQAKARLIRDNLMLQIRGKRIRHLVLTLEADYLSLSDQITNFLRCFKLLRQTDLWRWYVTGGAAFLELKWNPESNRWHPHLHILFEGWYLPHEELSPLWSDLTDGSFIVYLRPVPNDEALSRDVTKYAGKGVTSNVISNPERLQEAIVALNSRRVCTTFGTWRKFRLLKTETDPEWEPVASFDSLLDRATAKDPLAVDILTHLLGRSELARCTDVLPGFT